MGIRLFSLGALRYQIGELCGVCFVKSHELSRHLNTVSRDDKRLKQDRKKNMAYIQQVSIDEATGDTEKLYQAAIKRAGGVANIIRVMSRDGASANASMGFYVSVMKSKNSLSAAQREMLATVVSNANDCFY